jgi:hypothetical protein
VAARRGLRAKKRDVYYQPLRFGYVAVALLARPYRPDFRILHRLGNGWASADPSRLVRLGVAGGHEFFTDDPKKFSDLILFVLGGIPNTTGVHVLDGGVSTGTKNQRTGFVAINGQPAFVNFTNKP